ncbi:leucine-rich repeat-containing protein 38 [Microcaecilia unicolor]|uniref:Leucine-rich repeat-containing protein 38 n=1 Tax=Microcaecilia unicolor TaxID=1415580 RepID=A0A6P7ZF44_9AMPH|nr:leucine-rich repeat-containing protein 38 [Microcaecilia unicolor]
MSLTMLACVPLCLLPSYCFCCLLLLPWGQLCPPACTCIDFHTIDCMDQGLRSLPSAFPLDVRKLLAANNHIRTIPADLFVYYGDLVYLDLRNNCLTSLEEGTFVSSSRLVFLDLSFNALRQLDAGIFKAAEKLIKLSLGNNNLSEVNEAAFETLDSLQVLELQHNNLQSLHVGALEALPSLRAIRLEGNPWLCDCDFAKIFFWIEENASKLQQGMQEIHCSLEDRRIYLHELSEISFSECKFSLSVLDFLIIFFSGVAVSIAAIFSSFFLASTVHCFQKCAPSKDDDEEDEDED